MKKYIIALVFLALVSRPIFAEETATLSLQQEYQKALITLISLLQEQVVALMAQLKEIQATQTTLQANQAVIQDNQVKTDVKVDSIVQNTAPVQPVFGAVVPEIKKELKFGFSPILNSDYKTINYWDITVKYTENGKPAQALITVSSDDGVMSQLQAQQTRSDGVVYESFVSSTTPFVITASANGINATTSSCVYYDNCK